MSDTTNTTQNISENPMATKPVLPLVFSMSLPSIFSMLILALYNIVDSMFVAWLSEDALAAVSLVFPAQNLIIALASGTAIGINSLVARRLGEKNQKSANSAATHGILLGVLNGIFFVIFGAIFIEPYFTSMADNPELVDMTMQYAEVVLYLAVGVTLSINIEKILQATGNMIGPMTIMLTGSIINIILDPILIFGLLGFPALGVRGAAIATVIGQFCGCLWGIYLIARKKEKRIRVSFRGFKLDWAILKSIYVVALPSIIMQSIASLTITVLNMILLGFSELAVSVLGVYFKLQSFIMMPVFGITSGLMPIMGFNYGAKNKNRLMETFKLGLIAAFAIMITGTLIFNFFPEQLMAIFDAEEELVAMGAQAMRILSLSFIGAAFGIITSTMFQSIGNGLYSLILSLIRQVVGVLPLAWFLSQFGLVYVWMALPLAELVAVAVAVFLLIVTYKNKIKPLQADNAI